MTTLCTNTEVSLQSGVGSDWEPRSIWAVRGAGLCYAAGGRWDMCNQSTSRMQEAAFLCPLRGFMFCQHRGNTKRQDRAAELNGLLAATLLYHLRWCKEIKYICKKQGIKWCRVHFPTGNQVVFSSLQRHWLFWFSRGSGQRQVKSAGVVGESWWCLREGEGC